MTKHSWTIDNGLVRDLRFAVRGLRRTPSFTIVAIASLALGLALTTTMVSVVNAYLVRSLPYPEADRLYHVRYAPPGPWEPRGMTGMDWPSVRDVVEFPIASAGESFYLDDGGYAVSLRGLRVMQGFVEGLGVTVAIGAPFHGAGLRSRIRTSRAHRPRAVARAVRIRSRLRRTNDPDRAGVPSRHVRDVPDRRRTRPRLLLRPRQPDARVDLHGPAGHAGAGVHGAAA